MGHRKRGKQWVGLILVILMILVGCSTPFRQFMALPSEMRVFSGNLKELHLSLPTTATVTLTDPNVLSVNGKNKNSLDVDLSHPLTLLSKHWGQTQLTLSLFGKLPLKKMNVKVLPDVKVIPGGQSLGVKLKSEGVLVVGHHKVGANQESPGAKADIRVGDYIVEMDGEPIHGVQEVARLVKGAGDQNRSIPTVIKRGGKKRKVMLYPTKDSTKQTYGIGLYVRDSAAGVGTLTFYDPQKKRYGALGHVISDVDTGKPIRVGGGKIVQSEVTSIQKGQTGDPGEKRAIFFRNSAILGSISKNTQFGVFGTLKAPPKSGVYKRAIPVGLAEEVKEGPAEILTVVDGKKVERYNIEIVHRINQKFPATKGMIIKVTDPRLLNKSGGIVQGMSGSPILQDGKLVGAVTHVFVNDPTSGYGTYIEWMLKDAGLLKTAGSFTRCFLF
ncbi:SpoIVB peptidase [Melghirimyces algeriensis]|uniref:Stage IV sporulation protein B n=1 Tax=Melghirimyces algeriensis TaxID=910412 RepID=A0A521B038_9BACL|nr:SpoIVB peptidase [Melghirimyces algeriensis]SMO40416.1 stage IV sporulation protein B [Melghirimyces algeriensis]